MADKRVVIRGLQRKLPFVVSKNVGCNFVVRMFDGSQNLFNTVQRHSASLKNIKNHSKGCPEAFVSPNSRMLNGVE